MLKGTLSNLTPAGKLAIFILLVISFLLFSTLVGYVLLIPFLGSDVMQKLVTPDYSDQTLVNSLKGMQIINMAGGLLLPAMLYHWLVQGEPIPYIKRKLFPGWNFFLISALLLIIVQPFISFTNDLNEGLKLPESLKMLESMMQGAEKQAQLLTDAFLASISLGGLMVNIFMIAILPAVAEEFVFRGVLTRLFQEWTRNKHLAVLISALIFAAIHLQFYGFLPRFLLGVVLGYLFVWSGSLWLPMLAHFTNNFLSIIIEYLYRRGTISINSEQFGFSNIYLVVALSLILSVALLYYLHKGLAKFMNPATNIS
ncbi:MAG: CPBP family intramembrane metalloprotease [Bacteroidetes bacterium]|nr:CPBP family intramembrane metalloprotease [Bacteroidota bacterium]